MIRPIYNKLIGLALYNLSRKVKIVLHIVHYFLYFSMFPHCSHGNNAKQSCPLITMLIYPFTMVKNNSKGSMSIGWPFYCSIYATRLHY